MKYKSDFDVDLKAGEIAEAKIKDILCNVTIEVKRDSKAYKTGNVAVEYECSDKPSGIAVTKATWWCFFLSGGSKDEIAILVKTSKLKQLARKYYLLGHTTMGGDNNLAKIILIKKEDLVEWGKHEVQN